VTFPSTGTSLVPFWQPAMIVNPRTAAIVAADDGLSMRIHGPVA
jgi:hypothetical protein